MAEFKNIITSLVFHFLLSSATCGSYHEHYVHYQGVFEPRQPLAHNENYTDIFISSNSEIIPRGIFCNFKNTTILGVGFSIFYMEPGAFIGLENLKVLELKHNKIHILRKGTFEGLHSLDTLLLEGNPISYIEPESFSSLNHLKHLELRYLRALRVLQNDMFSGLSKLQVLDVSKNYISVIEVNAFRGIETVRNITLSSNVLTEVPLAIFEVPNLEILLIDYNRIETLGRKTLAELIGKLKVLDISGNPVICKESGEINTKKSLLPRSVLFIGKCF